MKQHKGLMPVFAFFLLPGAALILLLAGCTSPPKPVAWNLEITAKTPDSGRLDVIGIRKSAKQQWEAVVVTNYWKADNVFRKNAPRLSFEIVDGKFNLPEPKGAADTNHISGLGTSKVTISRKQAILKKWMEDGAAGLVLIGQFRWDSAEGPDPRKMIRPLYKQSWDAVKNTLQFGIQDGCITVETREPPNAPPF